MKGRRITEAYEHASQALGEGLAEANDWAPGNFGGVGILSVAIGCVRGTYNLSMRKIKHLGTLPRLLARLGEPGMKHVILREYDSHPKEKHHRVTKKSSTHLVHFDVM